MRIRERSTASFDRVTVSSKLQVSFHNDKFASTPLLDTDSRPPCLQLCNLALMLGHSQEGTTWRTIATATATATTTSGMSANGVVLQTETDK